MVLPDTHFPFVDKKRLAKTISYVPTLKPTHIVQIGDLFDFYNFSRFPKSNNVATPNAEVRDGRWMAEAMWRDLKNAAPNAECFQVWGNHEERPFKRIMENAPALEKFLDKSLKEMLSFPGVTTMGGILDELEINGIIFTHGWSTQPGYHVKYFSKSVVHGHTHHGGTNYLRLNEKTLFELDCGILADYFSRPMIYRSSMTCKWTPGFGWIDSLGPRFCPL